MNVVLYVNSFFPSLGGKEFVVHFLADALTKLGHDARVVGPAGFWKHRHVRPGYPIHRWPTLQGHFREQVLLSNLKLDTAFWGCDVIHAHSTYPNGFTALKLKQRNGCPVVITPHGADIQTIPEIGHGLRLDPVLDQKIVSTVSSADYVTAISENIESVILEAGAPPGRVKRVPNGVDLDRFSRPPSVITKERLGVEADARLIVTVGRYNPRKGFDYLIRAMPEILQHDPRVRLVIVGQDTEALKPLIEELQLSDKVVLTGGINPPTDMFFRGTPGSALEKAKDEYADLLLASEVYVSAGIHRNSEGLSLAVLEGMAASLPIVATEISGNTDVIVDGVNGLLVEPANEKELSAAIARLLMDDDQRATLSKAARRTAEEYGWLNVARQYEAIYSDAIDAAHRSG